MEKDDQLDGLISKLFKNIKDKVVPPKTVCPSEEVLRKHLRGELKVKETERLESHMLSCPECLDTHEVLRLIETAEGSLLDVPEVLLNNTKKSLRQRLQQPCPPAPRMILLLWDHLNNRITQLSSKLSGIVASPIPELQAVREHPEYKKGLKGFPFRTSIKGDTGKISLEVDRSRKKGFLTLKVHFYFTTPKPSTCVRVVLYKKSRRIAAENLDDRGEVSFHAIKAGTYYLELFEEKTCTERIEIPIVSVKNE